MVRHALDPGAPRVLPTLFRIPVRCGVRPKNALVRDGAHSGKLANIRVKITERASFARMSRLGVEAPLLAYAAAKSGRESSRMKSTTLTAVGATVGPAVVGAMVGPWVVGVPGAAVLAVSRVGDEVVVLETGRRVGAWDIAGLSVFGEGFGVVATGALDEATGARIA